MTGSTQKHRILVVEDEPDIARFICAVLSDEGHEVLAANNGVEASRSLTKYEPDLVTLDIVMPDKSGVRFYRELRSHATLATTPVIMVTGVRPEFRKFISTRRQVPPPEGYLPKPFTAEELLAMVRSVMGGEPSVREVAEEES